MGLERVGLVIPSYMPPVTLPKLVQELRHLGFKRIFVVDDGSPVEYEEIFKSIIDVHLLVSSKNEGKGRALKRAYGHILQQHSDLDFVICCDDDGQHLPEDVLKVALAALVGEKKRVYFGSRSFDGKIPTKSLIGNRFMNKLVKLVSNYNLKDTQTGLRCIPRELLQGILELPHDGFNFELVSLLHFLKHSHEVHEIDIQTIYFKDNNATRFKVVGDSYKVVVSCLAFYLKR